MAKNEEIVFFSSIIEDKDEKRKPHKNATVKKTSSVAIEYHETYY